MLARRVLDQYQRIGELTEALRKWDVESEPQLSRSGDLADLASLLAGMNYVSSDIYPMAFESACRITDLAGDMETTGDTAFLVGLETTDPEAAAQIKAARKQEPGYDQYLAAAAQPDDKALHESWLALGEPSGARAVLDGLLAVANPPTERELDQARVVATQEPLELLLEGVGLTEPVHQLIIERYAQRGSVVPDYLVAAGVQPADLTTSDGAVQAWVDELWVAWETDGFPEGEDGFWRGLKHL